MRTKEEITEKIKQTYKNGHLAGFIKGQEEGYKEAYMEISSALEAVTKHRSVKFNPIPRVCMRCATSL